MNRLYRDLKKIVDAIPMDFGGGCSLQKSYLMAYIAKKHSLKNYAEIGVYKGRSFFPLAHAFKDSMAYGIDPYSAMAAKEYDLEREKSDQINTFIDNLDFEKLYGEVEGRRREFGLESSTKLLRSTSAGAVGFFRDGGIPIGMLHIDGNHDTKYVMEDVALYLPLISQGGFVVLDDTDWDSVKPAVAEVAKTMQTVITAETFVIFQNARLSPDEVKALNFELETIFTLIGEKEKLADEMCALKNELAHAKAGRKKKGVLRKIFG